MGNLRKRPRHRIGQRALPAARGLGRWLAVLLLVSGCALMTEGRSRDLPSDSGGTVQSGPAAEADSSRAQPTEQETGRAVASLQLVQAGRSLIEDGRPDEAIRLLERAVNVSPGNGQAYFYLAEAWLMKDDPDQAAEYNRLASMHLSKEAPWPERLRRQAAQIQEWLR